MIPFKRRVVCTLPQSFEEYYETKIKKPRDYVTKNSSLNLWNKILEIKSSGNTNISREGIFHLLSEETPWMNAVKFYRKRQIALDMCDYLLGQEGKILHKRIEDFTITEFYNRIDYRSISFYSVDDMASYIIESGEKYRTQLSELLAKPKARKDYKARKTNLYSYELILAFACSLWEGLTTEEIVELRIKDEKFFAGDSGKEIRFLENATREAISKVAQMSERVSINGTKNEIIHDGRVFWKELNKKRIYRLMDEFQEISPERELSPTSIDRSVLFSKLKEGKTAKKLTPVERAEYESWLKAFQ